MGEFFMVWDCLKHCNMQRTFPGPPPTTHSMPALKQQNTLQMPKLTRGQHDRIENHCFRANCGSSLSHQQAVLNFFLTSLYCFLHSSFPPHSCPNPALKASFLDQQMHKPGLPASSLSQVTLSALQQKALCLFATVLRIQPQTNNVSCSDSNFS